VKEPAENQSGAGEPDSDDTSKADGPESPGGKPSLSFFQIVGSTLAAAFGVQSSRNRQRDFSHGRVSHFIVAGVIFTVLFVLAVIFVVRLVLSSAGG
jgi:hypothetical protein